MRVEGDGWKEALEQYKAVADDLHAGRTPRVQSDGLTVADLCNRFLTARLRKVEAGEMGERMFAEYKQTTDRLVATFGKTRLVDDLAADDFETLRADLAKQYGPVRLGNAIQKVRTVFKYGLRERADREAGPIRLRSSRSRTRPSCDDTGRRTAERMLEADELRQLLDAAGVPTEGDDPARHQRRLRQHRRRNPSPVGPRPRRRLGGLPPSEDRHRAPLSAVAGNRDRDPRGSGGAADAEGRGRRGARVPHLRASLGAHREVAARPSQFSAVLRQAAEEAGIHRDGLGFYTLRHVFRTVADAARDPVAIDLIMGHTDATMGSHYRERIEDSRLRAVAEHVRAWLFGEAPNDGPTGQPEGTIPEAGNPCDPGDPLGPDARNARPILRLFAG